ncbi:TraB/GumN family protein [Paenibacillus sp. GYB003]|uniref:TraB/GumN family protein n=1 Tax=Paenibacillus sp. GYB003 TaxID=2994392 RepID=UPI002F9630E8
MKRITWNKWSRRAASGLLGAALLLGSVLPLRANEAAAPVPAISPWSVSILHEGEKYGIFPLSWYDDGTFQQPIAQDKFQSLLDATASKLDALGFSKQTKHASERPAADAILTRDTVLRSIYGVLTRYELPESFEIGRNDPIGYLQQQGIVNGTEYGLELDRPCTVEQAAVFASRLVRYAYETAGKGANGLFWKVTKGGNTLYLLGSIHLGIPDMYPLHKRVTDAFESSDALWVEANLLSSDREAMNYFMTLTTYDDGTTLKDHVAPETYAKLQSVAEKLNLPPQSFDALKPWVISGNLSLTTLMAKPEDIAQATNSGVDLYFTLRAMFAGKPVHELEGVKLQGDLLSSVPPEQQEKELNQLLDSILNPNASEPDPAVQFKNWQLLWAKGDAEGFTKAYSESLQLAQNSGTAQRLLGERDRNMANKLSELLEQDGSSTYFIVVGAAHFTVKDMVIDKLKQKGYDVRFVQE